MKVSTAQLPDASHSLDRVFVFDDTVVILDGASAFAPVAVSTAEYVDLLGRHLQRSLSSGPRVDLRTALHAGIRQTARELELMPGESPSSTVAIVRRSERHVEALVLGDILLAMSDEVITDDRLQSVAVPAQIAYKDRLIRGSGFDTAHREMLADLQSQQRRARNRPGGYWVAEADPDAAAQALVKTRLLSVTRWAVLATDGAYVTMQHLGLFNAPALTSASGPELLELLRRCESWEATEDPDAVDLPRAKRHDDKTLAVMHFDAR